MILTDSVYDILISVHYRLCIDQSEALKGLRSQFQLVKKKIGSGHNLNVINLVILTDLVFNPIAYETDASVSSKIGFLEKILKSTMRGRVRITTYTESVRITNCVLQFLAVWISCKRSKILCFRATFLKTR